jgi:hypothetical protein
LRRKLTSACVARRAARSTGAGFSGLLRTLTQRSCLNRGAVAHHPLARAASAAPLARARAKIRRERVNAGGGECRVGRSRCRADVAVWRRVSCWSHAAARARRRRRTPAPARRRIRGPAGIARSPPTNDRHQQTIDVGRRAAAARCPSERHTGGWRSSRTPQVDLACSSLSTGSRRSKRAMP